MKKKREKRGEILMTPMSKEEKKEVADCAKRLGVPMTVVSRMAIKDFVAKN